MTTRTNAKLSAAARAELERLQAPVTDEDVLEEELDLAAEQAGWDPAFAEAVDGAVERSHEADRRQATTLAAIRTAFGLTQVELARRMNSTQGRVSKVESGGDMLLSTLLSYLHAAGLTGRWTVASPTGEQVDVDLDAIVERSSPGWNGA
ncbi:MAG: helix-turn-helix domain-containing protein [Acidimicrobiales bacterium]